MMQFGRILIFMYSNEHIEFLKKRKKDKFIITTFQILIFVVFIFIWQILANHNIVNTFIFSSPKKILETIINLYKRSNTTIRKFCRFYAKRSYSCIWHVLKEAGLI